MEKWYCWIAMGVGGLLLVLFLLDIILSIAVPNSSYMPFGGINKALDVFCIIASGILVYVAWDAYKEIR
jgi:hypothetical protein